MGHAHMKQVQVQQTQHRWGISVLSLVVAICVLHASPVFAEDVRLDVEMGTDLPVSVGGKITARWSNGLRVSTGLGYLPRAYVALINEVVQQFPYSYDAATGDLIEETLQNSLIWHTHLGWQTELGLYIDTGYRLAALGGGTSTEALLVAITDWQGSSQTNASANYDVTSVLHMVDLEVGWTTDIDEKWSFRTALGVAATLAASATVESETTPRGPSRQRFVNEFEAFSERYLVDTYTEYVITPVITVGVGYRLL